MTKSFDQNLSKILKLQDDTIIRTQEDKMNFVRFLMEKDKEKQLSEYIRNGINTFYKIYENETYLHFQLTLNNSKNFFFERA